MNSTSDPNAPTLPALSPLLALPRELRDKIYTSLLFPSDRPLHPSCTTHSACWHRAPQAASGSSPPTNNYSLHKAHTVANVLATNRQLHREMQCAVERARRRGELGVWGDCMVVAGRGWVCWRGGGGVTSRRKCLMRGGEQRERSWMNGMMKAWGIRGWGGRGEEEEPGWRTRVERVWLRVRVWEEGGERGGRERRWVEQRMAGAVLAALKQLLEHGMAGDQTEEEEEEEKRKRKKDIVIEEVVLNLISTPPPMPDSSSSATTPTPPSTTTTRRPRELATHLLAHLSRLWAADTAALEAHDYSLLLERIGAVRVCADGVECGRRGFRGELERGRGELRRIAGRWG